MAPDTRERILSAAVASFTEAGFGATSLGALAERAGVPKGNFFHHFPTKESMWEATLDVRLRQLDGLLSRWDREPDARARLRCVATHLVDAQDDLARHGCPFGALNNDPGAPDTAVALFERLVTWAADNFAALGFAADAARAEAVDLLARFQGLAVLAAAYGDGRIAADGARRIDDWLATVEP